MPVETRSIDHLIIMSRDLDHAEETYRRLGFCIAPRMFHPFGTANNLIMFQANFLELLGIVAREKLAGLMEAVQTFLDGREGASHTARNDSVGFGEMISRRPLCLKVVWTLCFLTS